MQSSSVSRLSYKVQLGALAIHSPFHRALEPLLQLGHDKHAGRERHEKYEIYRRQRLSLEHHLQRGKIDHQQLAEQREGHRRQEHAIRKEADLEYALGL